MKFPSRVKGREHLTSEQRLSELKPWLNRVTQPGFVWTLCSEAWIHSRLLALFEIHEVARAGSAKEALQMCGFEPAAIDEAPRPARNGEPMTLPLSARQQQEAERAWHAYQQRAAA